jgi:hypothetical protein
MPCSRAGTPLPVQLSAGSLFPEAQQFLARALELDPAYAEALAELGYLSICDGRPGNGNPWASDVVLRRSWNWSGQPGRALHRQPKCNSGVGIRSRPRACRLFEICPTCESINLLLGGALWAGLWEDAERSRRAIAADPINLCGYADNSSLLSLLRRHQEAIARAEEACTSNLPWGGAEHARGGVYLAGRSRERYPGICRGMEKSPHRSRTSSKSV